LSLLGKCTLTVYLFTYLLDVTLYDRVTVICATRTIYDCNVCFVKVCRSNVKLFWLVSCLYTCVSAVSQVSDIFTMSQSRLVLSRPNSKCLGSSHVSTPMSNGQCMSHKKCLNSITALF